MYLGIVITSVNSANNLSEEMGIQGFTEAEGLHSSFRVWYMMERLKMFNNLNDVCESQSSSSLLVFQ